MTADQFAPLEALDVGHGDACRFPDIPCVCTVSLFALRAAIAEARALAPETVADAEWGVRCRGESGRDLQTVYYDIEDEAREDLKQTKVHNGCGAALVTRTVTTTRTVTEWTEVD